MISHCDSWEAADDCIVTQPQHSGLHYNGRRLYSTFCSENICLVWGITGIILEYLDQNIGQQIKKYTTSQLIIHCQGISTSDHRSSGHKSQLELVGRQNTLLAVRLEKRAISAILVHHPHQVEDLKFWEKKCGLYMKDYGNQLSKARQWLWVEHTSNIMWIAEHSVSFGIRPNKISCIMFLFNSITGHCGKMIGENPRQSSYTFPYHKVYLTIGKLECMITNEDVMTSTTPIANQIHIKQALKLCHHIHLDATSLQLDRFSHLGRQGWRRATGVYVTCVYVLLLKLI